MGQTQDAPRRQYHIHSAMVVYTIVSLLVAIGAFNSQNNLLFWLFGLSLGMIIVSGVVSGAMMMGVRVEREPIIDVHAGHPTRVRYIVRNTNRFVPVFALTISELTEVPRRNGLLKWKTRPSGASATANSASGGAEGGRAVRRGRLARQPEAFVVHVPPEGAVVVEGVALAKDRGVARFEAFRVSTGFPFGVIRKSLLYRQPTSFFIRPAIITGTLPASWGQRSGQTEAQQTSQAPGSGDEFLAVREYIAGDSPRLIAWKASARARTLLVRQTTAASPRRLWVLLDIGGVADKPRVEEAISRAAGLIVAASQAGLQVGLSVPALRVATSARAGRWHASSLLNDLAVLDTDRPTTMTQGPWSGSEPQAPGIRVGPRDSCVVVHAGPDNGILAPIRALHVTADGRSVPVGSNGTVASAEAAA